MTSSTAAAATRDAAANPECKMTDEQVEELSSFLGKELAGEVKEVLFTYSKDGF